MALLGNFLGKWFALPPALSAEKQMALGELAEMLSQRFSRSRLEIQDPLMKKFAQIKFVLKAVQSQLKSLEESQVQNEDGNQRLRKVVSTTKSTFLRQMNGLLERLSPPTAEKDIQSYCLNSHAMMKKEISFSGKNIIYTGVLLKEEMKDLGTHLQELEQHLLDLQTLFLGKPILLNYAVLSQKISSISQLVSEKKNLSLEKQSLGQKQSDLSKLIAAKKTELYAFQNSPEFFAIQNLQLELSKVGVQKKELEQQCLNLFSPADKCLAKFQSLVEGKQFILGDVEEAQVLLLLNSNPFLALKRDISAKKIKLLLEHCLHLVQDGKITFKEKEIEKKTESLQFLISYDFYGQFFWKLNDLEKKELELKGKIASSPLMAAESALNLQLQDAGQEFARIDNRLKETDLASSGLSSRISAEETTLQTLLSKTIPEKIVLKFE